mgnify:CR=1 FL=1
MSPVALTMTLAEFASVNADASYTLVRAGLRIWSCDVFPSVLVASVFAEVQPNTLAVGTHAVKLTLLGSDGASVLEQASLDVTDSRVETRFVIPIWLEARRVEQAALHLEVGGSLEARTTLSIRRAGSA